MPTRPTYPGVYVEEIPSGVRTITGVATSISAFIDYFDRGPMNRAVQLFNMGDFQREFGGLDLRSEASYAIQQFFMNGGTEAWVVRVASDDPATLPREPAAAQVRIDDSIPAVPPAALTVTAISAGEWGNRLRARVDPLGDGRFNLTISDFAAVDGRNMLVGQEIWRNLSMDNGDRYFVETVVNDPSAGSNLVRVGADGQNAPLANGTLSDQHPTDPTIPDSPKLRVTIGEDRVTVPLRLSGDPQLPNPVPLRTIAPALQSALRGGLPARPAFAGATVEVIDGRLRVLAGADNPANRVLFANVNASTAADDLLLTGANVNRAARLSGSLGSAGPKMPAASPVDVTIGAGGPETVALDFSDLAPGVTLPGGVSLAEIAPRLQAAIVGADAAFAGVEVHAVGGRLVVLSNSDADQVVFANTGATTTADDLLLTGATNVMATLSGEHAADPQIQAAPPVEVTIDGNTATAALVYADTVTLPGEVGLATTREVLQAAIQAASADAAFSEAMVAIVRGDRLLVLPGANSGVTVDFANTPGTTTADRLQLAGAATSVMATLSGEHAADPQIQADPEVEVTIGGNTATAAPDFADLAPGIVLPGAVPVAEIAPRLQAAIRRAGPNNPAFSGATVDVVENDRLLIVPGGTNPNVRVEFANTTEDPTAGALLLTGDTRANLQEYRLGDDAAPDAARLGGEEGANGVPPDAQALIGDELSKTGIHALEDVDLFNLLCIPRVVDLPEEQAQAVISVAQTYCEKRRAFFLMDTPGGVDEVQEIRDRVEDIPRHRNAALFYPRVKVPDPLHDFRLRSVGASGTMAGLFARTDSTRGVWKAPAGTEATLVNVSELEDVLTDQENGALNPLAINCLRNFPIYGNVAWGARTLDGSDQEASEWKYIPVRRLALFLEESLYRGLKWVVFEPNDEPLWAQIRLNVGAFMHNLFRQGAFQGQTSRSAYFVKCDGETTTQNDIDLGIVNILVGFAPLKPAEFVILKIQQIAGQIET